MELKDYQRNAVRDLKNKIKKLLNLQGSRHVIILKAPTGSGKTVMASCLLEEMTDEMSTWYDSVVKQAAFIWIAPNKLHEQSYFKMKNYFARTSLIHTMRWDEIDHSLDYLRHGDILFLNWESINKDNALIMRDNEQHLTLIDIAARTQIEQRIPLIVIIDEEHMFAGRNAPKAQKVLSQLNPKIELRISATPTSQSNEQVTVYREDVVKEEMIKRCVELNPALQTMSGSALNMNQQLLKQALDKRDELARKYAERGSLVNPLLLIQLPNDNASLNAEDKKVVEDMKAYLDLHNISVSRGNLAVWLSGEKTHVDGIEDFQSPVKVLLFKQAIALGWDCPRAAVLLIFRELKSETFTIQTVGRILRMPEQRFYTDEALNKGYVYTNLSAKMINIVQDDMNYISTLVSHRKKDLNNVVLTAQSISRPRVRNRLGSDFRQWLKDMFLQQWALTDTHSPHIFFTTDGNETPSASSEPGPDPTQTIAVFNRQQAARRLVTFDIKDIVTIVPRDMIIQDEAGRYEVKHKARFARTQEEVDNLFWIFCQKNVGSFAKADSTPVLVGALMMVMEDLFQVFETEAKRIILHPGNQSEFEKVIHIAIEKYREKKAAETNSAGPAISEFDWHLPESRSYNEQTHRQVKAPAHALQPFYALMSESKPEQHFRLFLEQNADSIEWWYKNGDSGRDNFSIAYKDSLGQDSAFFVDFVIRMKDGTICLFDTKTPGSDPEGANKHNALIDWISQETQKRGIPIIGGILIGENDFQTWKFAPAHVDNISNTQGRITFTPRLYGEAPKQETNNPPKQNQLWQ